MWSLVIVDSKPLGNVVQAALALGFPLPEAARQLETIINWRHYAKLLAYDDDSAVLSLAAEALLV